MKRALETIKNNIQNQNAFFVFATDVEAHRWSEYILENDIVDAISSERFIAWDSFKAECIRSTHQEKTSIPTILRKFFALSVLEKNKSQGLFKEIINPHYIHISSSFANWIATLLPELFLWEEHTKKWNRPLDAEDRDLLQLKREYSNFLDRNSFFDPAWERPPFHTNGNTYFIIYPEILQDFSEYREILEHADCIELVRIDSNSIENQVLQYTNARSELREAALFIRELCTSKSNEFDGIKWSDVALTVKDIETYEPYLRQEFSLYNIPIRIRSGKPLANYPGGRLFSNILDCYTEKFSFASLKNLILDPVFPWRDPVAAEQLIDFGIKNNCLCTYDDMDIWEHAFKNTQKEERARDLYTKLKKIITALVKSTNFNFLLEHYMEFRNNFFNPDETSEETNAIISRCIAELLVLIDLEKNYPEATICENPLNFFIERLQEKEYVKQSKENGVNIFTYKLACAAPFKQHIILDSSQNSLTVSRSALSFLREDKRKALNIVDENTSQFFVHLYSLHSDNTVRFSFSQNGFSGYNIPFNGLVPKKIYTQTETETSKEDVFPVDNYYTEKEMYLGNTTIPASLHNLQFDGFMNWIQSSKNSSIQMNQDFVEELKDVISKKIVKDNKIQVSATTLRNFYECPIKWLFSKILKVDDFTLEGTLLDETSIGTFYHEVIKRVLSILKMNKIPLSISEEKTITKELQNSIQKETADVVLHFPESCSIKGLSDLTIEIFKSQEQQYIKKLLDFFSELSIWFNGSYISEIEKDIKLEYDGFDIVGTIDCILDYPGNDEQEAGTFILDFKTGNTPNRNKCLKQEDQELKDFQLPLYVQMYEHKYFAGKKAVQGCAFMSIHKKSISPLFGILITKINDKKATKPHATKERLYRTGENNAGISFEDTMNELNNAILDFVNAMQDETLSLFTDSKKWAHFPSGSAVDFDTCLECEYKKICRTTYSVSGVSI